MRIVGRGTRPARAPILLSVDGRAIEAYAGESIAAALIAAGEHGFRRTPGGSARGVFCGTGVCQECLVVVDGVAGQRACMTAVRAGTRVETQRDPVAARAPARPVDTAGERTREAPDVLVVGGGAAGLAAALAAARASVAVTLIDERPSLGGQFYKQLATVHEVDGGGALDAQFADGAALIAAVAAAGVRIVSGATVWGAFGPQELAVESGGRTTLFAPTQIVLATGAYERAPPLPGWTLPGVMTTGAAQTLLRAYRVAPGHRVLLAGNGPLNLQVAAELLRAGVAVVALVEAAVPSRHAGAVLRALRLAPDLIASGFRHLWTVARAGVPVLLGHVLAACTGQDRVTVATVAAIDADGRPVPGSERRFEVDAVCMGYGFLPSSELARALGCRHRWDEARRSLVVERDPDGRTSVPGVFVVGDGGGLGGARVARAQGTLAGIAVARALGKTITPEIERDADAARAKLDRDLAFQRALWAIYAAPPLDWQLATADTVICRCEEVTRRNIDAALAVPDTAIGTVKRDTRAGMGRCQGRYCGPLLAQAACARTGTAPDDRAFFAPRAPIKPVALRAIARKEAE